MIRNDKGWLRLLAMTKDEREDQEWLGMIGMTTDDWHD